MTLFIWSRATSEADDEPKPEEVAQNGSRFTRGDFIEVTTENSVYRGTALDTRDHVGWATFMILVDGHILSFNLNRVEVKLLFSADVARKDVWVGTSS